MKSHKEIVKHKVMRRVYVVYLVRSCAHFAGSRLGLATACMVVVLVKVSIFHIVNNASTQELSALGNFVYHAFLKTEGVVQVASVLFVSVAGITALTSGARIARRAVPYITAPARLFATTR